MQTELPLKQSSPSLLKMAWTGSRRGLKSAWLVALVVLVLYALWLFSFFEMGGEARDFILPGRNFLQQSQISSLIKLDPTYTRYQSNNTGYDGQFCYYLALDPRNARFYMDDPAYRYTRILYPMAARLLAFGQADLIPFTLIIVNWLALAGGTLAVAAWLKRKGLSPWLALVYGLYPGFIISLQRDLTEILAYSLIAVAVYFFDFGGRWRILWAGLGFALAVLARESVAIFPFFYALSLLFEGEPKITWQVRVRSNWLKALLLLVLAISPMVLYKIGLALWLKSFSLGAGSSLELIPFQGIIKNFPWENEKMEQIRSIIIPALICFVAALVALWKGVWRAEVGNLLVNIQLFIIMLPASSYVEMAASARIGAGVVLAALYCLPYLFTNNRSWFWASTVLWLSLVPFWLIIPTVTNLWLFFTR